MYGSIFNFTIKPGHEDSLLKLLNLQGADKPDGMISWFLMNPDDKKGGIGVAVFESKEAYVKNANSPEQHQSFLQIMEHLEKEPTWTDGTYVISEIYS